MALLVGRFSVGNSTNSAAMSALSLDRSSFLGVDQEEQIGFDLQLGGQQQALAVRLQLDHADGIALPLVTEFHPALPGNADRSVHFASREFRHHCHGRSVADADHEGGSHFAKFVKNLQSRP